MALREEETWDTVVFYCKDCNKIVPAERAGRKYVYRCLECNTKNVAFGTERSIRSFFHVRDEAPAEVPQEVPQEAAPEVA